MPHSIAVFIVEIIGLAAILGLMKIKLFQGIRPLVPRPHLHHLIVYEGDSVVKTHIGNWSDYETMMQEKFGKDLTAHRVKYGTLKR